MAKNERIPKVIVQAKVEEVRRRDTPRTWTSIVSKRVNLSLTEASMLATDIEQWIRLIYQIGANVGAQSTTATTTRS